MTAQTVFRCTAVSSAPRATTWCATSSACRSRRKRDDDAPDAHYLAPRSLLVFDHLTRRAALLHAGSEHERTGAAARSHPRAARRPAGPAWQPKFSPPEASLSEDAIPAQRRDARKEYIAAGDVYQLVLSVRFAGRCDLDPFEAYRALGC